MTTSEIIGYVASAFIGISLGLVGGGGSILTVPVLVYLFGINSVLATAYSLFIVGVTSLAGTLPFFKRDLIDIRAALIFSGPSMVSVFLARKFLLPSLPDSFFVFNMTITKESVIMVVFAFMMIAVSYSMISKPFIDTDTVRIPKTQYWIFAIEGLVVGSVTGLVGAGGGFLIIPALVIYAGLPMKTAVGTSLIIIAIKSLFGFLGDVSNMDINWGFILVFSFISIIGIFIGAMMSNRFPLKVLPKVFGWMVLGVAIYILIRELLV